MKLELKHLAPYPMCEDTGLLIQTKLRKATTSGNPLGYYTGRLIGVSTRGSEVEIVFNKDDFAEDFDLNEIKPILRPLTDLVKEIEHNGEKFIPGLRLVSPDKKDWDKMVGEEYNPFPKIPTHAKWIQVTHKELGQVISINPNNTEHLPYDVFIVLLEWHFDVFGLIEEGLAIDINTL